jgi:hypothetical protein
MQLSSRLLAFALEGLNYLVCAMTMNSIFIMGMTVLMIPMTMFVSMRVVLIIFGFIGRHELMAVGCKSERSRRNTSDISNPKCETRLYSQGQAQSSER